MEVVYVVDYRPVHCYCQAGSADRSRVFAGILPILFRQIASFMPAFVWKYNI
jgi:hypothetical protein